MTDNQQIDLEAQKRRWEREGKIVVTIAAIALGVVVLDALGLWLGVIHAGWPF